MFDPFANIDRALAVFDEPLVWRQDAAPHHEGAFSGQVLQASPDAQNAGNPIAPITADQWSVNVSISVALVAQMKPGDTITRARAPSPCLTIQQIAKTEAGWLLTCTANERSPH